MSYSELIKNFDKIREYMRQFYVYGFKTRSEFGLNSPRSYDNEHRRVTSWLSEYMRFRHNEDGKVSFISIDSRQIMSNPFHKAFKTKSFTDNDIVFHFYVLDLMSGGKEYSVTQIVNLIDSQYLSQFENATYLDESTIRKKLKEYVKTGLIKERKQGKELLYSRSDSNIDLNSWESAICFFSQYSPVGVIGSYISDRKNIAESPFRFKHSYIFQALDYQILYKLIIAINEQKDIILDIRANNEDFISGNTVHPLKIYISTQNGRQYLLCYHKALCRVMFVRLDNIISLALKDKNPDRGVYLKEVDAVKKHLWGVALNNENHLDSIRMTIHLDDNEEYIFNRLMREKRCGEVTRTDKNTCIFTAQVYDALELLPWIRTFVGRIEDFYCSVPSITARLNNDIADLQRLYGGDNNAVF